jgi:hypothetical protein
VGAPGWGELKLEYPSNSRMASGELDTVIPILLNFLSKQ